MFPPVGVSRRIGHLPHSGAPHPRFDAGRPRRNANDHSSARPPCAATRQARAKVWMACASARISRAATWATHAEERAPTLRRASSAPRRERSAFRRGRALLHRLYGTIQGRPTAPPRAPYTRTPRDHPSEICSKRPKRFIDNRCCARGTVRARPSGFLPRLPPAVRRVGGGRMSKRCVKPDEAASRGTRACTTPSSRMSDPLRISPPITGSIQIA